MPRDRRARFTAAGKFPLLLFPQTGNAPRKSAPVHQKRLFWSSLPFAFWWFSIGIWSYLVIGLPDQNGWATHACPDNYPSGKYPLLNPVPKGMDVRFLLWLPLQWYLLWALLVPICLTVIPPKPYRAYLSCALLFAVLVKAQFFSPIDHTADDASIGLILQGIFFNLFFYTFNLFFLVEYPELTDYRPRYETLADVRALQPRTWKKFKWCVQRSILVTLVGHGWNWQISSMNQNSHHYHVGKKSTVQWLKRFIVRKLIIGYTIYDIFFHLHLSTDFIRSGGWGEGHTKDLMLFSSESKLSTLKQLILAFGSAYCIHFGIDTLYNLAIFANVFVLRVSSIDEFPELFGSFQGQYTVRSLWGNVWHKLMYQVAVPQSKYLAGCDYKAKHLNEKPRFGNETWRKYFMFFLVFVFTGIFHAAGTLNMPWKTGAGYNINSPFTPGNWGILSRCFYSFIFFPAQFALILVETFVQWCWNKYVRIRLPRPITAIIGLTWIALSEVCLLQMYSDEIVKAGFNIAELTVPFTPVHYIFTHWNIKF